MVGFFSPLSEPITRIYVLHPQVNLAVLFLPIGIGLHKQKPLFRKLALVINWLVVLTIAIVLIILMLGLVTGTGEVYRDPLDGDSIAKTIGMLVIVLPLFIWQFRVLASAEIREFFEQ